MKNWIEEDDALKRTFNFRDFAEAMRFMQIAATEIDRLNHHPEWSNVYNRVNVTLRTHDAGNSVTEKDRILAGILDQISEGFQLL